MMEAVARGFHPRLHYSNRYAVRCARGGVATKYSIRGTDHRGRYRGVA